VEFSEYGGEDGGLIRYVELVRPKHANIINTHARKKWSSATDGVLARIDKVEITVTYPPGEGLQLSTRKQTHRYLQVQPAAMAPPVVAHQQPWSLWYPMQHEQCSQPQKSTRIGPSGNALLTLVKHLTHPMLGHIIPPNYVL